MPVLLNTGKELVLFRMKLNDKLSEIFDIEPIEEVKTPVVIDNSSDDVETDFAFARKNIRELVADNKKSGKARGANGKVRSRKQIIAISLSAAGKSRKKKK